MKSLSIGTVKYILRNAYLLRRGEWPDPACDGTLARNIRRLQADHSAVEFLANVELRLKKCGWDGYLTYIYYNLEMDSDILSRFLKIDKAKMHRNIECVLQYICGKYPKGRTYDDHKRHYEPRGGTGKRANSQGDTKPAT